MAATAKALSLLLLIATFTPSSSAFDYSGWFTSSTSRMLASSCHCPSGPKGLAGLKGYRGYSGPKGYTGPRGPKGLTGPAGPAGVRGPTGPKGPQGPAGPAGPAGPVGPVGPVGGVGPAGPQGPAGPAGPQGPAGPAAPAPTCVPQTLPAYTIDDCVAVGQTGCYQRNLDYCDIDAVCENVSPGPLGTVSHTVCCPVGVVKAAFPILSVSPKAGNGAECSATNFDDVFAKNNFMLESGQANGACYTWKFSYLGPADLFSRYCIRQKLAMYCCASA